MKASFYEKEVIETDKNGKPLEPKKVLFFKMSRHSMAGKEAIPFEFDNVATEKHKKDYPQAWMEFNAPSEEEAAEVPAKKSKKAAG